MIYPNNLEEKIGFSDIRNLLKEKCLSSVGKEKVDGIAFSQQADWINSRMNEAREMRLLLGEENGIALNSFRDMRESVARLRLEGTYLEESELFELRRSLSDTKEIIGIVGKTEGDILVYPALNDLAKDIKTFPEIIRSIDKILDKFGHIRDNASTKLQEIRGELARTTGNISKILNSILRSAQNEGLVERDVSPAMRDGRLVIPVAPSLKRKIGGIVHDESATGKTVFIEPTEVVEANNRIRELEAEERREIIKILRETAKEIRPYSDDILMSYGFLGDIDLIRSKALLAEDLGATEPKVENGPMMDWGVAKHPLLLLSLRRQEKPLVPLDINLSQEKRILIISGPNAGGKSVCLKTVGLLQYMVQSGIPITVSPHSNIGVFKNIMIDIGDEQSIEDDLSTYSSHLTNMKNMMRHSDRETLLLIDEFGGGTEPSIGGAIAESVLRQLCRKGAYGVITTHYRNLKEFADHNEGVANGAMLYDRQGMRPLFLLSIGQPGSSFAIEIARKTGIPEEVIKDASEIVGQDYIQSDKFLQDIVRDKRYWENKRQAIRQREKILEERIAAYEKHIKEIEKSRKDILCKAKEEADSMLKEANRRIENTIKEIRENEAEKEKTRQIREELEEFRKETISIDQKANDEFIEKKIRQIEERRKRKEKRRKEKRDKALMESERTPSSLEEEKEMRIVKEGSTVRIKGTTSVGIIEKTDGKTATIIFGDIRTKMALDRIEQADAPKKKEPQSHYQAIGKSARATIEDRKLNFHQDLDVRGMRGDEALNAVTYFIDDAIVVGMPRVRILHGTGNGILRQLVRQYLATVPNVISFRDEHVQFGGSGITVVDL